MLCKSKLITEANSINQQQQSTTTPNLTNPKNKCFPTDSPQGKSNVLPMSAADAGMRRN
jgi:hypothetical protein